MTTQDAVRQLRLAMGMTQERFARRMGLSVRTVARWEAQDSLSAGALSRLFIAAQDAKQKPIARFLEQQLEETTR